MNEWVGVAAATTVFWLCLLLFKFDVMLAVVLHCKVPKCICLIIIIALLRWLLVPYTHRIR